MRVIALFLVSHPLLRRSLQLLLPPDPRALAPRQSGSAASALTGSGWLDE